MTNLNGTILTEHFVDRIDFRGIPLQVVEECLQNGKKYNSKRNIIIKNRFVSCYMSVVDGAGLTLKLSERLDRRITSEAKQYGASKRKMTRLYFESIGYKS